MNPSYPKFIVWKNSEKFCETNENFEKSHKICERVRDRVNGGYNKSSHCLIVVDFNLWCYIIFSHRLKKLRRNFRKSANYINKKISDDHRQPKSKNEQI